MVSFHTMSIDHTFQWVSFFLLSFLQAFELLFIFTDISKYIIDSYEDSVPYEQINLYVLCSTFGSCESYLRSIGSKLRLKLFWSWFLSSKKVYLPNGSMSIVWLGRWSWPGRNNSGKIYLHEYRQWKSLLESYFAISNQLKIELPFEFKKNIFFKVLNPLQRGDQAKLSSVKEDMNTRS